MVGSTKTYETRSVPYPQFLDDALEAIVRLRDRGALLFGNGLVYMKSRDTRRGWYVGAMRRAQDVDPTLQRVTLHDLRHTAASLAVSAGANVKAVQRMPGPASAAMTLDFYADLFDDDLDAVGVALNDARSRAIVGKMWANDAA